MLNLRIVCPRLWHPETLVSTLLQYLHCSGPSSTFIPYCRTSLYYHWAWFCAAPLEITPIMTDDRFLIAPEYVPPESLHSSPRWFDAGEGWSSNRLPIWIFSCRCLRGLAKVGSPNIPTTSRTKATGTDSNWGEISKRSWLLLFHDNYTSEILWLCKTLQDNTEHHETTKMEKSAWIVWSILWLAYSRQENESL